ncbi:MAG: DUF1320 family protein [Magnetococcales bacterium]|nr:DUF1320 family protein [Magnetococcales bacterium]
MYASPTDLLDLFGAAEVAGIARPDDLPPDVRVSGALMRLVAMDGDQSGYPPDEVAAADRTLARIRLVLTQVSARMDTYLARQHTLPLPGALIASGPFVQICADLARFAMDDDSVDQAVRTRHDDATRWLERIASGQALLSGQADPSSGGHAGVGRVQATPGVVFFGALDGF